MVHRRPGDRCLQPLQVSNPRAMLCSASWWDCRGAAVLPIRPFPLDSPPTPRGLQGARRRCAGAHLGWPGSAAAGQRPARPAFHGASHLRRRACACRDDAVWRLGSPARAAAHPRSPQVWAQDVSDWMDRNHCFVGGVCAGPRQGGISPKISVVSRQAEYLKASHTCVDMDVRAQPCVF